jgi:hypothetical protein
MVPCVVPAVAAGVPRIAAGSIRCTPNVGNTYHSAARDFASPGRTTLRGAEKLSRAGTEPRGPPGGRKPSSVAEFPIWGTRRSRSSRSGEWRVRFHHHGAGRAPVRPSDVHVPKLDVAGLNSVSRFMFSTTCAESTPKAGERPNPHPRSIYQLAGLGLY